jgi:hypothetical protein
MDYDMAYFDMESHQVSALENPFGPKVLGWTATVNYVVGTGCKPCVRYGPFRIGEFTRIVAIGILLALLIGFIFILLY